MRQTFVRFHRFWSFLTLVLIIIASVAIVAQSGCGGGGGGHSLVGAGNSADSAAISGVVQDFFGKIAAGDSRASALLSPRMQALGTDVTTFRTLVIRDFGADFFNPGDDATHTFFLSSELLVFPTPDLAKLPTWTQLSDGSRWEITFWLIRQQGQWFIDEIQIGTINVTPGTLFTGPVAATALWPVAQGNTWQFAEVPIASLSGNASGVRADFRVLSMPGTTGAPTTGDVGLTSEQFSAPLSGGLPTLGIDWASLRFGSGVRTALRLPALDNRSASTLGSSTADLWAWLDPFARGGWRLSTTAGLTYHGPDSTWNNGQPWRLTGLVITPGTVTRESLDLPHISGGRRLVEITTTVLENLPVTLPSGLFGAIRLEILARDTSTSEQVRTTWILIPGTGLAAYLSFSSENGLPSRLGLLLKAEVGGRKVQVSPTVTEITPPLITASTFSPVASAGVAFTWVPTASKGLPPYSWRLIEAPDWLTMDVTGRLAGTPPAGGSFLAIIELADANGFLVRKTVSITVSAPTGPVVPVVPPLTLASSIPAANAVGVATSAPIELTFSAPVDPTSISSSEILVTDATGTSFPGAITVSGNLVRFAPSTPWPFGAVVSVRIGTGIRSVVGSVLAASVQLSFTVAPAPAPQVASPPLALPDAFSGIEDQPLVVGAPAGVLANDIDYLAQGLTAQVHTPPATGSLLLNPDGSLSYAPLPNANGLLTFAYQARDVLGSLSAAVPVALTITPVNDPPTFTMNAQLAVGASASLQTFPGWAFGISAGPGDETGQGLTFLATTSAPGLFQTQPTISPDGTLSFQPAGTPASGIQVTVILKDNGGTANNGRDTSLPRNFLIDLIDTQTVPVVTGPALASSSQPTWTWTPAAVGQPQFRCRLNDPNSSVGELLTPATSFTPISPLPDGVQTLYVQQMDLLGGWSVAMSWAITIDTISPAAPHVSAPASTTDVTPLWTWTGDSVGGVGLFRIALDGESLAAAPTIASTSFTPSTSLPLGTHILAVQERDAAGNWSVIGSASVLIVSNPVPPAPPTVLSGIATSSSRPRWSWSGDPINGSGYFRFALDGVDILVAPATQSTSFMPVNALSEGFHTLAVQERNTAGIWSASGLGFITIDQTPPAAPVFPAPIATTTVRPKWAWTGDTVNGSGVFRIALDGADISAAPETTSSFFIPATPLSGGLHVLQAQERDGVGNWSTSGYGSISVILLAPAAPVVAGPIATSSAQPTWTWTGDVASGVGIFRVALDGADISVAPEISSTFFTPISPLPAGVHILEVQERNGVGLWSTSGYGTMTIILTAPATPVFVVGVFMPSAQPTWTWTGDVASGAGIFRFALDGADITAAVATTSTSFTPASPLPEGDHVLEVQERNTVGLWSSSAYATITVDLTGPSAPVLPAPIATSSAQPQWTWTGDLSTGAGVYRVALDGSDITLSPEISSNSYIPASPLTDGDHVLAVQERDLVGNWSASGLGTITVDLTPPGAPLLSGTLVSATATPNFIWSPADGTGDGTYRYKLDDEDFSVGAIVSSDTSFTPSTPLTDGPHTLYVQARDAVGNWSASGLFATTIDSTPPAAPIIFSPAIAADIGGLGNGADQINAALKANMSQFAVQIQNNAAGAETGSLTLRLIDADSDAENNSTVAITSGASRASYGGFANGAIDGFSNGAISIEASIVDEAGNRSASATVTLADCLYDGPVAVLANVPPDPTDVDFASIEVLATGAIYYRYQLDSNPPNPPVNEQPINSPIVLSGLSVGQHTLKVMASADGSEYQPDSWATTATFTYQPWRLSQIIATGSGTLGCLESSRAVAFRNDGTQIAVADTENSRVQIHLIDGALLKTIPIEGTQTTNLSGVAFDHQNNLFVLDGNGAGQNNVVLKFAPSGPLMGSAVVGDNSTIFPSYLAVDPNDGTVYVSATDKRVWRFDNDLNPLSALGTTRTFADNPGSFTITLGVAVDENSQLYVIDDGANGNSIHRYNPTNQSWAIVAPIVQGESLAVDSQYLWTARHSSISSTGIAFYKYSKSNGSPAGSYTCNSGNNLGDFNNPYGIAANATAGYVVVSDAPGLDGDSSFRTDHFVQFFNPTSILASFSIGSTAKAELNDNIGVAVDANGNTLVLDTTVIKVYSPSGLFLSEFGSEAIFNSYPNNPNAIAIDGSGNIWVTTPNNDLVYKFSSAHTLINSYPVGNMPWRIAINDVAGRIAFACSGDRSIKEFSLSTMTSTGNVYDASPDYPSGIAYASDGRLLALIYNSSPSFMSEVRVLNAGLGLVDTWGSYGAGPGDLNFPEHICVGANGFAFIANGDKTIKKFTLDGNYHTTITPNIWQTIKGFTLRPNGNVIISISDDKNQIEEWTWP